MNTMIIVVLALLAALTGPVFLLLLWAMINGIRRSW